jgi:hypothetical protein
MREKEVEVKVNVFENFRADKGKKDIYLSNWNKYSFNTILSRLGFRICNFLAKTKKDENKTN